MRKAIAVTVGFSCVIEMVWRAIEGAVGGKSGGTMELELGGTSYNTVVALQRAGIQPHLMAAIGDNDDFALVMQQKLVKQRIAASLFGVRHQTPVSLVLPHEGRLVTDRRSIVRPLRGAEQDVLRQHATAVRVVTGLLPDRREVDIARLLFRHQTSHRRLNILNPRGALIMDEQLWGLLPYVTWLVMNRDEAEQFFGLGAEAQQFLHRHGTLVVVTKDVQGAEILTGGARYRIPAYPATVVVHETGAGDCFLGYFLVARLQGLSWQECLKRAVVAAGLKVGRPGSAASPAREEVDAAAAAWHVEAEVD